jgi:hypothetical protein
LRRQAQWLSDSSIQAAAQRLCFASTKILSNAAFQNDAVLLKVHGASSALICRVLAEPTQRCPQA